MFHKAKTEAERQKIFDIFESFKKETKHKKKSKNY